MAKTRAIFGERFLEKVFSQVKVFSATAWVIFLEISSVIWEIAIVSEKLFSLVTDDEANVWEIWGAVNDPVTFSWGILLG